MDTTYSKAVALAVPIFLALIGLELLYDRIRGTRYYRLADALNSLSCGMVSTGMRVYFGFLGLFFYQVFLDRLAPVQLSATHWATWLFALVFYDFCYYWNHRLGHTCGLFGPRTWCITRARNSTSPPPCASRGQARSLAGFSTFRWRYAACPSECF